MIILCPITTRLFINKSTHFWYIWNSGFLLDRNYEFKFLKSKNIKIITLFCGDDIRSVKLTNNYAKKNKIDTHTHYQVYENKIMQTNFYDLKKS